MDLVQDTLVGAQCLPKDVTKYLNSLEKASGGNGAVEPEKNDTKAFLSRHPKGI